MKSDDLLEESNRILSEMVALALQGERLQRMPVGKGIEEATYRTIFQELTNRAKFMERKNGEMVSYAKESMAELDTESDIIRKHLRLLDLWRRRALARLGEVDAMKKNLVGLIIASEECSARFGDQLLTTGKGFEKLPPAQTEELMTYFLEKRERAAAEEKLTELESTD